VRFLGGQARIEVTGFAFDSDAGDSADANSTRFVKLHAADIHLPDAGPPVEVDPKPHIVGLAKPR
jgi:hypothetical protein